MKLSLKFKDGFWSNELNKSFSAGLYQAKDLKEFNALAKHGGVEPIEEPKGKKKNNNEGDHKAPEASNEGNQ